MKCLENRKIRKSIPEKSDYYPNNHVALIVPHTRDKPGAFSPQLQLSEYLYMEAFYKDFLVPTLLNEGINASIHYRDRIGIAGAYQSALSWKPFIILEMHFNAFNGFVRGFEILYKQDLEIEKTIALDLLNGLEDVLKTNKRGLKRKLKGERGFVNVSQTSKIPSLLIEPFFGDNKEDAKNFDENKEQVAIMIAEILGDHWEKYHKNDI